MLIKYENEVINLANVSYFFCLQDDTIRFLFNFSDDAKGDWAYLDVVFESKEERREAWTEILADYAVKATICLLD